MTDKSVSRRSIAKGAAWAVPAAVVSATAPAYAASCVKGSCSTVRRVLIQEGTEKSSGGLLKISSTGIVQKQSSGNSYTDTTYTVKFASQPQGNTYLRGENLVFVGSSANTVSNETRTSVVKEGIYLSQSKQNGSGQIFTVTLPQEELGDFGGADKAYFGEIEFDIFDIDRQKVADNNKYVDKVEIRTKSDEGQTIAEGVTITGSANTIVNGNTVTSKTETQGGVEYPLTEASSKVHFKINRLTSNNFSFIYSNAEPGTGTRPESNSQQIIVGNITYKICCK